jgi:hypothetical protein
MTARGVSKRGGPAESAVGDTSLTGVSPARQRSQPPRSRQNRTTSRRNGVKPVTGRHPPDRQWPVGLPSVDAKGRRARVQRLRHRPAPPAACQPALRGRSPRRVERTTTPTPNSANAYVPIGAASTTPCAPCRPTAPSDAPGTGAAGTSALPAPLDTSSPRRAVTSPINCPNWTPGPRSTSTTSTARLICDMGFFVTRLPERITSVQPHALLSPSRCHAPAAPPGAAPNPTAARRSPRSPRHDRVHRRPANDVSLSQFDDLCQQGDHSQQHLASRPGQGRGTRGQGYSLSSTGTHYVSAG